MRALALSLPVHHDRAEKVVEHHRFNVLVARAVGPLWKICKWFQPHWGKFDCLLAVKGPRWVEERGEARHRGLLGSVELEKGRQLPDARHRLGERDPQTVRQIAPAG